MGKADDYFEKENPYQDGIKLLREIALTTELEETVKWGAPVYTIKNKNVLGIMAFKSHFGLWFFNGVFLSDPENVLENAQEGKTKAMRHWKFTSVEGLDKSLIREYIQEAIENQKRGLTVKPEKKSSSIVIPDLLKKALKDKSMLLEKFEGLSPYKQREYCEYIDTAKQERQSYHGSKRFCL